MSMILKEIAKKTTPKQTPIILPLSSLFTTATSKATKHMTLQDSYSFQTLKL